MGHLCKGCFFIAERFENFRREKRQWQRDRLHQEKVVLIHYTKNATVITFRYKDDVENPAHLQLKDLPEDGEEELSMMTKIVDKMTKDLDLKVYHDCYK